LIQIGHQGAIYWPDPWTWSGSGHHPGIGIQVFSRPSSGTGTTVIHLMMPYQASLQLPEEDLIAKYFLVGDTGPISASASFTTPAFAADEACFSGSSRVICCLPCHDSQLWGLLKLGIFLKEIDAF